MMTVLLLILGLCIGLCLADVDAVAMPTQFVTCKTSASDDMLVIELKPEWAPRGVRKKKAKKKKKKQPKIIEFFFFLFCFSFFFFSLG
jgi:hypothetical protein